MFDRIIVSSDDSHFVDFWPIVSMAWKKFFPDKKISIAFVTNRNEEDEIILKMKNYGEVVIFKEVEGIPTANVAKMARHVLAGRYGNEVCMIEDIDTIPLQRNFIERILSQREKNKLLLVGTDVYKGNDKGKYPISNMTAESKIFKEVFNPLGLGDVDLFKSWCDINVFDHKESINNKPDLTGINGFSDESLVRVLLSRIPHKKKLINEIARNVNPYTHWIDRSMWNIDLERLYSNDYIICNFLRPFSENYELIKPIIKFIFNDDVSREKVLINV